MTSGWRSDRYVPGDAFLRVRGDGGRVGELQLPQRFVPYVLLRYQSGAMIPVPMRIVLVTIDLTSRRVVLQYQSTFAVAPPIRKIELRLSAGDSKRPSGESVSRFEERTQATLADLAACSPPQRHAVEACATPLRRPNPLIFFPSGTLSSNR
jgi:hypothetical protein